MIGIEEGLVVTFFILNALLIFFSTYKVFFISTRSDQESSTPTADLLLSYPKRTKLDYFILLLALSNVSISLPWIINSPNPKQAEEKIRLDWVMSFAWTIHFIHLFAFDRQKESLRHFFFIYCLALIYKILVIDPNFWQLEVYDLAINLLPIILIFMICLADVYKPALNAKSINNRLIGGRFPSPEVTASPADIISFGWIEPLMKKGFLKPLEAEDLPDLRQEDKMAAIIKKWIAWRDVRKNLSYSVVYDLFVFSRRSFTLALFTASLFVMLEFANPLFINLLLNELQKSKTNNSFERGAYILLGLLLSNILRQIIKSQNILVCRKWGYQIRSILIHEIFKKSLKRVSKLSCNDSKNTASDGKIVSLMSSDVNSIKNYFLNIDMLLIDVPISTCLSISGLCYLMGPSALSGLVVILISGPATSWALTRLYKSQREVRTRKDKRIQITNETFLGIRIIKYYSWEESFYSKMVEARMSEIKAIWDRIYDNILVSIIGSGSSILITFISFFFYTIVFGHQLDAATAFSSITLMSEMNQTLNGLGKKVAKFLDVRINIERINNFLEEEEVENTNNNYTRDEIISLKNATFEYHSVFDDLPSLSNDNTTEESPLLKNQESSPLSVPFSLRNITVNFPIGKLSIIVGKTGAGKTSLLLALLNEMKMIEGTRLMPVEKNQIAFCPQTPWLTNDTIRENILFGREYDSERYYEVVKACQLLKDLENLEYGDLTEIGEKGVNLSGGQKARISLARACYSKAKLLLLDDPLSAVDAPTARFLLNHCILTLLKGKTAILVTHAVSLLIPNADHLIFMDNGSISFAGSPKIFAKDNNLAASDKLNGTVESMEIPLKSILQTQNREGKASGRVKRATYNSYFVAAGGLTFGIALLGTFLLTTLSQYLNRWWITVWTDTDQDQVKPLFFIVIFGIIGCGDIIMGLARLFLTYIAGLHAAQSIHDGLAKSVLGSPMRFFEMTPVGRLINRFDKDMGSIDTEVMSAFVAFAAVLIGSVLRIIIVAYLTPSFLIMFLLLVFYYRLAFFYLATSRELKRINSISTSPIYSLFGEVLRGVSSVRAYDSQSVFEATMETRVDGNHRADFYLFGANRYLQFRTAILSSMIVFIAGGSVLISNLSAGWAGLTLSLASSITSMLSGLVWSQSALELSMNAVERIDEYSSLPQEKIDGDIELPLNWPRKGNVEVIDLKVRYALDLPLVLKGLKFTIENGEKVAVVGRTGAGKSTLSLAFWRILEFEGVIKIDGLDISRLGVRDLRKGLTIIPQEPILFEGTIRSNIDLRGEHNDNELWDALQQTAFLETLQDKQGFSLDSIVSMNGNNFSQGQRQLLCLSRALLRSSVFLFLDEATASVDHLTDSLIQKTIRTCFNQSTIISVAHRLKTVIDFDKIIVLGEGRILEMGKPSDLLKSQGEFYSMMQETGEMSDLVSMIRA